VEFYLANSTSEIQTEHLNATIIRHPGCAVTLEIAVKPEATKAAYTKALKGINKEVVIPGFRKGKAPDSLILQQFSKHVTREWHDVLVNTAFHELLKHTHLYPLTQEKSIKKAEVKKASVEEGAQILIEYEARPDIPHIDFKDLQLQPVERKEVEPEDVEQTIHELLLRYAEWSDVEDRPVQEGDYVELDIVTAEEPPQILCQDMRFAVSKEKMAEWMYPLMLGRSVNDTVEGMSQRDSSFKEDPAAFKPTLCRITIKAIKRAKLPDLNDEFAKKVGLKTIEELRPRVEADLNKQADLEKQSQFRAQLEQIILKNYAFDLPASIFEKQRREMISQRLREEPPPISEERAKQISQEVQEKLQEAYQMFFSCQKIAEENGIQVYESEIQNEIIRQLMMPAEDRLINLNMPEEEVRSSLYVHVLSRKVLDFLVGKATVTST
jgi:trigger factor